MCEQEKETPLVISMKNGQLTPASELFSVLLEASGSGQGVPLPLPETDRNCTQFHVISVVGPPCSGKSFLANWIARYLASGGGPEPNWMDVVDQKAPLPGFSWNPRPNEAEAMGEDEEDVDQTPPRGIRLLRNMPVVRLFSESAGVGVDVEGCQVEKCVKIILLDIDAGTGIRDPTRDSEFQNYYAALAASCMLVATVAIFIDVGADGTDQQRELYNSQLLLALLDKAISGADPHSRRPDVVCMTNRHLHFQKHAAVATEVAAANTTDNFEPFFLARKIAFARHELPTLKSKTKGEFLGALEHMDKVELHLALTRMVNVGESLAKPGQSFSEVCQRICDTLNKINIAITATTAWQELTRLTQKVDVGDDKQDQGSEPATETASSAPTSATAPINATSTATPNEPSPKPLDNQGRHELAPTPAQAQAPEQPVPRPRRSPKTQEACLEAPIAAATYKSEEEVIIKSLPERGLEDTQENHPDEVTVAARSTTQPDLPEFQNRPDIDRFLENRCMPEFERLLNEKYLPNFMASSMTHVAAAQLVGELIICRHFEGGGDDGDARTKKKYAGQYIGQLVDVWLTQVLYITEALDKGRNLIDTEFDSEIYFPDAAELDRLLARGKRFASQRFEARHKEHAKLLELWWAAVQTGIEFRNAQIRTYEQSINEIAVQNVFGFYKTELTELFGGGEQRASDEFRVSEANVLLVADCMKILGEIKQYREEDTSVKAELKAMMVEYYSVEVTARIRAAINLLPQKHKLKDEGVEAMREKQKLEEEGRNQSSRPNSKSVHVEENAGPSQKQPKRPFAKPTAPTPPAQKPSDSAAVGVVNDNATLVLHLARGSAVRLALVCSRPVRSNIYAIPAYIAFTDGEFVIGDTAKNTPGCIYLNQIQAGSTPFLMGMGHDFKEFRYELLMGLFFAKCKEHVEREARQQPFDTCLIVIRATSSSVEREAIHDAANVAGFKKISLLSETSAVAFDYLTEKHSLRGHSPAAAASALVLILYAAGNGDKELGLYELSTTPKKQQPAVEMKALSGSLFLPFMAKYTIRSYWGSRPATDCEMYVSEVAKGAGISVMLEGATLVMAGDDHRHVWQLAADPDLAHTRKRHRCEFTRYDTSESALQGAVGIVNQLRASGDVKLHALCSEIVGLPVALRLPSGFTNNYAALLQRNARLPARAKLDLQLTTYDDRSMAVGLFSQELGTTLGTHSINLQFPKPPPTDSDSTFFVRCLVDASEIGTLKCGAQLIQQSQSPLTRTCGKKIYPLNVYRTDKLNLDKAEVGKYRKYIADVLKGPEERARRLAKEELQECMSQLKQRALGNVDVEAGTSQRAQIIQAELASTTSALQDEYIDLDSIVSQKLALQKLIAGLGEN